MAFKSVSPEEWEASEKLRLQSGEHRRMQASAHFASPSIVCLCGSTRFSDAYREASLEETLAGRIVLSIGCDMRDDDGIFAAMPAAEKEAVKSRLDWLHLRKIEWADEVMILNVGGYIGASTSNELAYARKLGKHVRFLEPEQA